MASSSFTHPTADAGPGSKAGRRRRVPWSMFTGTTILVLIAALIAPAATLAEEPTSVAPAKAKVSKVTVPAGYESGWTFDLKEGSTVLETKSTTGAGWVDFATDLLDGHSYAIVERPRAGWASDGGSAECAFTVALPADSGRVFACTYTNTEFAQAKVRKVTVPAGDEAGWVMTLKQGTTVLETLTTTGGGWLDFATLLGPGTYTIEETPKPGWHGDGGWGMCTFTLLFPRDAGAVRGCVFTNTKLPRIIVEKVTTGSAGGPFTFTTTGGNGLTTPFDLTTVTPGVAVQQSFEIAYAGIGGAYSVTEGITPGFVLTDVSCAVTVAGLPGTTVGSDLASRTGSITNLTAGTTVTCTFVNNGMQTTRTPGFWSTHLGLVQQVWNPLPDVVGGIATNGMTAAERTLCASPQVGPLTVAQVMGGFWSNIARTSTGEKRSHLDQARMQLLQHLLAAILNSQLFGSVPSGMTIDQAKAAYCGTSVSAIRVAHAAMASFNESGDSGLFTPGASAMPRESRAIADYGFWDVLP